MKMTVIVVFLTTILSWISMFWHSVRWGEYYLSYFVVTYVVKLLANQKNIYVLRDIHLFSKQYVAALGLGLLLII